MSDPKILVALDVSNEPDAMALAGRLDSSLCRLKIGKELFTACGPQLVERLVSQGHEIFLDLKFHDIPNTVAKAVSAAADLGVWMVNVHASGGERMMVAAREALDKRVGQQPLLIGVTVLTSMDQADLQGVGVACEPQDQVVRLAALAKKSGLDGVVCSAQEVLLLRAAIEAPFTLVTPGIRPADAAADDQRRIVTPQKALADGSDYLVIGRPITQALDPGRALLAISQSI